TWSVDGVSGGNATVGTISTAGVYQPPQAAGTHVVTATSTAAPTKTGTATAAITDLAGVLTYHNDNARTGQNLKEAALTPATVSASQFGKVFSCPTDGFAYAQPIYVANVKVGSAYKNVVYVVTEHATIYAFDGDASPCAEIWPHHNFGPSVPAADTGELG